MVCDCEEGGSRETSDNQRWGGEEIKTLSQGLTEAEAEHVVGWRGAPKLSELTGQAVSSLDTTRNVPQSTCGCFGELLQPQREVGFRQVLRLARLWACVCPSLSFLFPVPSLSSTLHTWLVKVRSQYSTGARQVLSPSVWSGGEHTFA